MYAQSNCSRNAIDLSHELLVVGFGVSDEGVPYWIAKNRYYAPYQAILSCIHNSLVSSCPLFLSSGTGLSLLYTKSTTMVWSNGSPI